VGGKGLKFVFLMLRLLLESSMLNYKLGSSEKGDSEQERDI
jgi:hypothetical protein